MSLLGVAQLGTIAPHEAAVRSRCELDRPLLFDAELTLALFGGEATFLGAFQREAELGKARGPFVVRRISGGPAARVGPGSIWLSLALARIDALVPCEPSKIVARHVRPLLRVLTKLGRPAQYAGRDFVAIANRPAAFVGFAHDAGTGRASFEAILGTSSPFALGDRPSFHGKTPVTLDQAFGKRTDPVALCGAIAQAYAEEHLLTIEALAIDTAPRADGTLPLDEPPWTATAEAETGLLGAGRDTEGRMRLGGELLASRDAVDAAEIGIEALGPFGAKPDVVRVVKDTLGAPGIALHASLGNIADLIFRAIDLGR
jgi:hypothetical protein